MKRSVIKLVNELREQLLRFPALVNQLQKKDYAFMDNLFAWIDKAEEILSSNNISQVAELSGLKSKILSAKLQADGSRGAKKEQLITASESLYAIQHLVLSVLEPREAKVEECRELIRQMLLIIAQTPEMSYDPDMPFEQFISVLWQFINSNNQLKGGAVKLKTYLTINDIPVLIAEEINLEDFQS